MSFDRSGMKSTAFVGYDDNEEPRACTKGWSIKKRRLIRKDKGNEENKNFSSSQMHV